MKRIAAIALLAACACARAAGSPFPSEQQQKCNELISIVAAGATWRDNYLPFSYAQSNLDRALRDTDTPLNLWGVWTAELAKVYGSKVTADKVESDLRQRCH